MKAALFSIFCFSSLFLCCKETEVKGSMDLTCTKVIDDFFAQINSGRYNQALDELLSNNPYIDLKDSSTNKLREQFAVINTGSGPFMGYKLLKKRNIENDVMAYSYLIKFEKRYFRLVFIFYDNSSRIRLYKFLFDSEVDLEIEESLKLYSY